MPTEVELPSLALDHLTKAIEKHGLTDVRPQIDTKTLTYFIGDGERFKRVDVPVKEARLARETGLLAELVELHVDRALRAEAA